MDGCLLQIMFPLAKKKETLGINWEQWPCSLPTGFFYPFSHQQLLYSPFRSDISQKIAVYFYNKNAMYNLYILETNHAVTFGRVMELASHAPFGIQPTSHCMVVLNLQANKLVAEIKSEGTSNMARDSHVLVFPRSSEPSMDEKFLLEIFPSYQPADVGCNTPTGFTYVPAKERFVESKYMFLSYWRKSKRHIPLRESKCILLPVASITLNSIFYFIVVIKLDF